MDFTDVQIMRKFTQWVTPDVDFKVTVFFNVKYLKEIVQARAILMMADW